MRQFPFRVEWGLDLESKDQIEPLFDRALALVPPWVDSIYIHFDGASSAPVSISFSHQYRTGRITFGSHWFSCSAKDKKQTIIHEILHMHMAQMSQVYTDLKEACTDSESPLWKWSESQWERAEEAAVSDLSFVIDWILEGV